MTRVISSARRRGLALTGCVLAIAMLSGLGIASAAPESTPVVPVQPARPVPLPPELDAAFYNPPAEVVAATAPGGIIAARQVNVANIGIIPLNVDAWQVSYRSNNSFDAPIPAVATLIKPRGASATPRKLLSFQIAEDSTAGYCAPSYALQMLSPATFVGQIVAPAEFVFAQAALQQGWAVVIPDHEGPNSAYAAGPLAGRITLDGIRAATSFGAEKVAVDQRRWRIRWQVSNIAVQGQVQYPDDGGISGDGQARGRGSRRRVPAGGS